jgi:hypothetical protein
MGFSLQAVCAKLAAARLASKYFFVTTITGTKREFTTYIFQSEI